MKRNLLAISPEELRLLMEEAGEKPFRANQLHDWLHKKRATTFDDMSNLSKSLRIWLAEHTILRLFTELEHRVSDDDLTEKWLWQTPLHEDEQDAGVGLVEAVLIREKKQTRRTVCVSCSIGCPVGCVFCASGRHGIERNLSRGEILEQVYRVDDACRQKTPEDGVGNVVFMGMGEPMLNYDEVLAAARTLASPDGMNLSGRHITISTAGVTPGILRLAEEDTNFRLALSLHAPNQALRETLIPTAKKWKLEPLMEAVYAFSRTSSRDVTVEYCLIDGVNDELRHARELCALLRDLPCKVNLIPYNPVEEYPERPSSPARVNAFQRVLDDAGISSTVRTEKGRDIDAACGQLRARRKLRS